MSLVRRKIFSVGVLALMACGASAADHADHSDPSVSSSEAPRTFSWAGAYAGLHGGVASTKFNPFNREDAPAVGAQAGYNLQAGSGVLDAELEGSYMNNEVPMPDGKVETRFRGVHVTESELMVPDRIDGIGSPGLPGYMDAQHDKLFRQAVNNARSSIAAPLPANAPIWSSNSPYGDFSYGGYSWNNDVWGTGAGPQTISVHAGKQWSVWSNQPNTDGIKSYPHQALNIEKPLSSINTLTSSFNQDVPTGGAWDTAYDIWDSSHQNEIMLWTNYTGNPDGSGNVKPISYHYDRSGAAIPLYRNVNMGGATWNVFTGSNGHNVISLLCTSKSDSGTVDIKGILEWLKSKGYFGDIHVGSVQYGVEITSSPEGMNFNFNNWSVSST
ncbi:glycoside hydrolase family 12 protein (plasmid) [Rhizobium leguminosarum]